MKQGNNSYKKQDNTQEIKRTTSSFKEAGYDARKIYNDGKRIYKSMYAESGSAIKTENTQHAIKTDNFRKLQLLEERQLAGKQISKKEAEFFNNTVKNQADVLDTKSAAWQLSANDRQVLIEMSHTKDNRLLMQLAGQASDKKLGLEWARLAKNESSNSWLQYEDIGKKEALKKRRLLAQRLQARESTLKEKAAQKAKDIKQENFRKEAMAAKKSNESAKAVGNGAKVLKSGEKTLKGGMALKAGDATLKGSKAAAAAGAKEAAKKTAKEVSKEASKELAKDAAVSAASKVTIVTAIIGAVNTFFKTIVKFAEQGDKMTGDSSKTKKMLSVLASGMLIIMIPLFIPAIILVLFTMVPHNPGHQTTILAPAAIGEVKTAYENAMDRKLDMYLEGTGLTRDDISVPAYSLHLKQCVAYWYITRDADAQREVKYGYSPFIADSNYIYGSMSNYSAQTQQLLGTYSIDDIKGPTPTPMPSELVELYDGADQDISFGVGYVTDTESLPMTWSTHHAVPRSLGIYISNEEGSDYTNLLYGDSEFWGWDQYQLTCSDLYALYKTVQDMNMIMVYPENKVTPIGDPVYNPDTGKYEVTYNVEIEFKTISNYRDPVQFAIEQNRSEEEIAALQQIVDQEGSVYEEFEHFWKALFRSHLIEAADYPSLVVGRGLALWSAMGGECSVNGTYYPYCDTSVITRYFDDPNGGLLYKDYWTNRNTTYLNGSSKISNLQDFGYPLSSKAEDHVDSWTIAGYLYSTMGRSVNASAGGGDLPWCAAFVTYCFSNGEQGYFDIPYAWTLNANGGSDTSGCFCSIASLGRFGTYDELVAMRQEVESQIEMICGTGIYTQNLDGNTSSGNLDAGYLTACQTLAELFGTGPDGSGCRTYNGQLEYSGLSIDALYDDMNSTTDTSTRVSLIQSWATTVYNNIGTTELDDLKAEYANEHWFDSLTDDDYSGSNYDVKFKLALIKGITSYLSSKLNVSGTDGSVYADTAAGQQMCHNVGLNAFTNVQNLYVDKSKFDAWWGNNYVASADDCAYLFWKYAHDNNLDETEVTWWYNQATNNGASEFTTPDMYAQFAWMTGSNGDYWPRSIMIWDPSNGYEPYTLYLHTNNYHIAFFDKQHSSCGLDPFGDNTQSGESGYVWYRCFYNNADKYLNMLGEDYAPWADTTNMYLYTNWGGSHSYGFPLDFMWNPYYDTTTSDEAPEFPQGAQRVAYQDMGSDTYSEKVWAVYHHENGKYIPYFDSWSCPLTAMTNMYHDDSNTTAGFFDLAWFFGANAADYYSADNLPHYTPFYDLFAEIYPKKYPIFYMSAGCTQILSNGAVSDDCLSYDSFMGGGNVFQPGDVMIAKGHIRLVADRWKDPQTGIWYIITIEGNTRATPGHCVLKFWPEATYCVEGADETRSGFWYHSSSETYYNVYRVLDDIDSY